ncbi:MAG: hypothetical protein U9O50_07010 [Acidobacteriota bacterium]|nr:hypothetical protein [Acidobacteriota bacterium]
MTAGYKYRRAGIRFGFIEQKISFFQMLGFCAKLITIMSTYNIEGLD